MWHPVRISKQFAKSSLSGCISLTCHNQDTNETALPACLPAALAVRVLLAAVIVIVVVAVAVAVAAQGLDRTTGRQQQLDKLTCCLLHICLHSMFPHSALLCQSLSCLSTLPFSASHLPLFYLFLSLFLSLSSNVTNCALVIFIRSCCCRCCFCCCHC